MALDEIRQTSGDKLAGSIRILLAVLFLMTGAMKLLVPMLAEAWSGASCWPRTSPCTQSHDGLYPFLRWHLVLFSPLGHSSAQWPWW